MDPRYPHLQLKNLCYTVKQANCLGGQRCSHHHFDIVIRCIIIINGLSPLCYREERLLDMINIEARGGELVAVLATKSKIIIILVFMKLMRIFIRILMMKIIDLACYS